MSEDIRATSKTTAIGLIIFVLGVLFELVYWALYFDWISAVVDSIYFLNSVLLWTISNPIESLIGIGYLIMLIGWIGGEIQEFREND